MSKTIEEAAKDYAYDIGDSDWERMRLQDAQGVLERIYGKDFFKEEE